jgi:RNA polymerase sigma-54 factor
MALENRLELKLSQKLVLTPQLQMAIKLLQMPQLELSQALNQELVENPFLEESVDYTSTEEFSKEEKESIEPAEDRDDTEIPLEKLMGFTSDDYFEERGADGRDLGYFTPGNVTRPSFEHFVSESSDLFDHLLWQLRMSRENEKIRSVGELIIGNIDENGYFRGTIDEIREISQTDTETVENSLQLIQSFDPPGIAARDIRECLQLQLKFLGLHETLAEKLVLNDLNLVGKKKYAQLAKHYSVPLQEIMIAVQVIEGLDPKPGRNLSTSAANYIIPDVYIMKTDAGYQIVLNDEGLPRLRLNGYYQRLLIQKNSIPKEDRQFLEDKLRSALWLLKSLDQRNKTIYRVTESLLVFQKDFFDRGINYLKPLNLKDVAAELGLHESTISRVTSNKFLSCPSGIYSFRFFFSNAIPSEFGNISSTSIKEMIKKIISEEDSVKPLSDMRIVDIFKNQNITIARRTIAKYREELRIPSQSQRKK